MRILRTTLLAALLLFLGGVVVSGGLRWTVPLVQAGDCGEETDDMTEAEKQAAEKACEAAKQAAEKARESSKKTKSTETATQPAATSSPEAEAQETPTAVASPAQQTVVTPVNVLPTYKTLTRYIKIIDSGYDVDTDGDKLVDAIDPDPLIPQEKYFTDSDNDTIPDALDQYSGIDDFFVEPDDTEKDKNGILDWMEGS